MLNYEKLAESIPGNKLYVGMAISEAMTNAYLVAKGVRNISESHLWGVNHPNLFEAIMEYCELLSQNSSSRPISIIQHEFSFIIYADSHKSEADAFFFFFSKKPSISDLNASIDYTTKVGVLLGYDPKLVEDFTAKIIARSKKRR